MSLFQTIFIQKSPSITLPTAYFSATPMENTGSLVGNGRVAANDGEIAARATRFGVRDFQSHAVNAIVLPLCPIEIDITLMFFFEDKT